MILAAREVADLLPVCMVGDGFETLQSHKISQKVHS